MKTLQILIPMGGLGQRFKDEGFTTPKPLIEVEGEPMVMHAIKSFAPFHGPKKYIFIIRTDTENEYSLSKSLKRMLPESEIVFLDKNTRGAAETCLFAKNLINNDDPLVIMDCDFRFKSTEYFTKVEEMFKDTKIDGVLLSFTSENQRYSYVVEKNGFATDIAEKVVISNSALAGAYSFTTGKTFVKAAESLLKLPITTERKEYYISYVYKELINSGKKFAVAKIDNFDSFGTPEELNAFMENEND